MNPFWKNIQILSDIIGLIYPETCAACGQKLVRGEKEICIPCMLQLPQTQYHLVSANPVEKIFRGRVTINFATSLFFFEKGLKVQRLLHEIKYKNNRNLARFLGEYYGFQLKEILQQWNPFCFIPVPLHPTKHRQRGFNQSAEFSLGLTNSSGIQTLSDILVRTVYTETQTKKSRFDRWQNVKDKFTIIHPERIVGKNLILVDDVITTGSTLESCAHTLLQAGAKKIGAVSIACAVHY
ncbi:MAG: ComF family protein [Candidatus Competibacteraceae bacterium]|nr:ComF family protein [Candidatus Competibacteraceae bacterium]